MGRRRERSKGVLRKHQKLFAARFSGVQDARRSDRLAGAGVAVLSSQFPVTSYQLIATSYQLTAVTHDIGAVNRGCFRRRNRKDGESASPLQRDRSGDWMLKLRTRAARIEVSLFELEVPFRRAVGVIDQHEMGI